VRNIIWFLHAVKEMFTKKGYSFILSKANDSPWLIDEEFKKNLEQNIKSYAC
jgi:hypothetical protein